MSAITGRRASPASGTRVDPRTPTAGRFHRRDTFATRSHGGSTTIGVPGCRGAPPWSHPMTRPDRPRPGAKEAAVAGCVIAALLAFGSCGTESAPPGRTSAPARAAPVAEPGEAHQRDTGLDYLTAAYSEVTGRTTVVWAPTVDLLYSGTSAGSIDEGDIGDPQAWASCPAGATDFAERPCPVSPLRAIELAATDGARIVQEEAEPVQVGCDQLADPRIPHASVISVRPDRRHRDCFSDFAVTLYLDESDTVTGVNFVLSAP